GARRAPGRAGRWHGSAHRRRARSPRSASSRGYAQRMTPAKPSGGSSQKKRLTGYRAKRDFAATPEPRGEEGTAAARPRFVIQEHSATRLHWDMRLERDDAL